MSIQVELCYEEIPNIFAINDIAEHPYLRNISLKICIACWELGVAHGASYFGPDTFYGARFTVHFADNPFGFLVQLKTVSFNNLLELLGECLGAPAQCYSWGEDTP